VFNPCRAAVALNGVLAGLVSGLNEPPSGLLLTEANGLKRGANQIAFFDLDSDRNPASIMKKNNAPELIELGDDLIAKATIKSLPVTPPDDAGFKPVGKNDKPISGPAWFKTQWRISPPDMHVGLSVHAETQGVVTVNGAYVGHYGKSLITQLVIDPALFVEGDEQTIMILDESGRPPTRLTVERLG
jgi:hypothetical protein